MAERRRPPIGWVEHWGALEPTREPLGPLRTPRPPSDTSEGALGAQRSSQGAYGPAWSGRWRYRWGRTYRVGRRTGEWWIGVRRNVPADAWECNVFGLSIMIGRR